MHPNSHGPYRKRQKQTQTPRHRELPSTHRVRSSCHGSQGHTLRNISVAILAQGKRVCPRLLCTILAFWVSAQQHTTCNNIVSSIPARQPHDNMQHISTTIIHWDDPSGLVCISGSLMRFVPRGSHLPGVPVDSPPACPPVCCPVAVCPRSLLICPQRGPSLLPSSCVPKVPVDLPWPPACCPVVVCPRSLLICPQRGPQCGPQPVAH